MKDLGKLLLLTLGMGLLAAALGQITPHNAQADPIKPVTVVNTPLPITGNVNVTNNPLNVSFNGMAQPVLVANTAGSPAFVRAVDSPARQPFQASVTINIADGAFFSGEVTGFTVPAGKRLILETATFDIQLPSPQQVIAPEIRVHGGSTDVEFPVVVQTEGTIPVVVNGQTQNETHYSGSQHVSFFADASTTVTFSVVRSANSQAVIGLFGVAGYLVDQP